MAAFSTNGILTEVFKLVDKALHAQLDALNIPADCPTRTMPWNEAVEECWGLSGDQETEQELNYVLAMRVYEDASNIRDTLIDSYEIFK